MPRFIVGLLIFTVLATNVAWALDDCSFPYSNTSPELTLPSDFSGDNQNNGVCDEPCIGWFHFVAIAPATKLNCFPLICHNVARMPASYYSFDQQPPIRPPQA